MIFLSKNKIPYFSIIICTYNRCNLLPRAIESLINQSEKDWEAIIVDDGSNDNTFEYAQEVCNQDTRFRYIYHKNLGLSKSRNVGINSSFGLYISFLDSDDEYLPYHLESRKDMLLQNPEVDLLHGGFEIIGDEYVPDINDKNNKIHIRDCIVGGTFFAKKSKMVDIGGFDEHKYGDDTMLYEKMKAHNLSIAFCDVRSYIYHRDTEDSICNTIQGNK